MAEIRWQDQEISMTNWKTWKGQEHSPCCLFLGSILLYLSEGETDSAALAPCTCEPYSVRALRFPKLAFTVRQLWRPIPNHLKYSPTLFSRISAKQHCTTAATTTTKITVHAFTEKSISSPYANLPTSVIKNRSKCQVKKNLGSP